MGLSSVMGLDRGMVGKSLGTLLSAERSVLGLVKIQDGNSSTAPAMGLDKGPAAHGDSVEDTSITIEGRTQGGGVAHGSRRGLKGWPQWPPTLPPPRTCFMNMYEHHIFMNMYNPHWFSLVFIESSLATMRYGSGAILCQNHYLLVFYTGYLFPDQVVPA